MFKPGHRETIKGAVLSLKGQGEYHTWVFQEQDLLSLFSLPTGERGAEPIPSDWMYQHLLTWKKQTLLLGLLRQHSLFKLKKVVDFLRFIATMPNHPFMICLATFVSRTASTESINTSFKPILSVRLYPNTNLFIPESLFAPLSTVITVALEMLH